VVSVVTTGGGCGEDPDGEQELDGRETEVELLELVLLAIEVEIIS